MNKTLFFLILLCFGTSFSQKLNTFSLQDIEGLQLKENRSVLIFVSSSWCTYCKKMKQTVFKNKEVIELLNKKYYLVFIEADSKEPIFFKGNKFEFKPKGIGLGYNQILDVLSENEPIAFPSILVYDSSWNRLLFLQTTLNKISFLELFN